MARLTKEQLEVYRTKRLLNEAEVHLLDTIAELERELRDAEKKFIQRGKVIERFESQLATGPCGKHPMWAWRVVNSAMPEEIRTPDHCILCEEVQAAEAAMKVAEGVADSGRKIAETAIRSDVQLGDHYAGYRGPCPHVSEHIECLHFMFKEFVPSTPAPVPAGGSPLVGERVHTSKLPGSFDARDWAKEFCAILADQGTAIDEGWMVTWFANAIMAGYDHAKSPDQRDETIARLRDGFTWAMAQLDDTQELRDEFGLVCVQCKPVNNEHATDCKLVKYRALLDQAQGSTQQRSGNAPTGSWASGEREGQG